MYALCSHFLTLNCELEKNKHQRKIRFLNFFIHRCLFVAKFPEVAVKEKYKYWKYQRHTVYTLLGFRSIEVKHLENLTILANTVRPT